MCYFLFDIIQLENRFDYIFLKVSSGFTENESLTLFAKNLACDKSKLPSQAKYIHALCKGMVPTYNKK